MFARKRQPVLTTILALTALMLGWLGAGQWYRGELLAEEQDRVDAQVEPVATALAVSVSRRLAVLDGLAAFVQSSPSQAALAARFEGFATELDASVGGVRALQVLPGGVNRYDYPPGGNETPLGVNVFDDPRPDVRDALRRALETRQTTLSGPYELRQGGLGMVAWRPIYQGDSFWGVVSVVFELPPLLEEAGLANHVAGSDAPPSQGLTFALRDGTGRVVYGPAEAFQAEPIRYRLPVADGTWELAGLPAPGWDAAIQERLWEFQATGLAIVGLLTGLTYLATDRQTRLAQAVRQRMAEIAQINTTLARQAALLDLAHDAILLRDPGDVISFWNPGAERLYGWTAAEALGAVSQKLLQTVFPETREIIDAALLRDGRWEGELIHTRRDGTQLVVASRQALQRDEHGEPVAILEINRDITERKQAEEALEQRVEERTRELAALLEVSHSVSSTLELRPLLGLILDHLRTVVDYQTAEMIALDKGRASILDYRGPLPREHVVGRHLDPRGALVALVEEVARRRRPVLIDDLGGDTFLGRELVAAGVPLPAEAIGGARSELAVPLIVRGNVIGVQTLIHSTPGYYSERHGQLAMTFALQAAVAIENARLYEQARGRAALEERQRLARELHDSVSQAVYSIVLNASAAEELFGRDPARARALLHDVLTLAEAALAEMRALIFELRPESLEREGLVAALEKQAAAASARFGLEVRTSLGDEPAAPPAVKEALYRIAQEALQNTAKHARARSVELTLAAADGALLLRVSDDGRGFAPGSEFPGHLGLHSMRERAAAVGGRLEIESAPGQGTRLQVRVPLISSPEGEV